MDKRPIRVAAIHSLAGFGRCSLSVILPVLSVMGVQACPVPTAVLSTHTGGLGEPAIRDLTDFIGPALAHYRRLGVEFESVYTGFLGSEQQIDLCLAFFDAYPAALKLVDPVMGDHGRAYKTYTKQMQTRMAELVAAADIITPNMTEAAMLLGREHQNAPYTRDEIKSMLLKLSQKGPKYVVITGANLAEGVTANVAYDKSSGSFWISAYDQIPVYYPGTGDMYASVLLGAFLTGDSIPVAMDKATGFLEVSIKTTFSNGGDTRYGVMFEKTIPALSQNLAPNRFRIF